MSIRIIPNYNNKVNAVQLTERTPILLSKNANNYRIRIFYKFIPDTVVENSITKFSISAFKKDPNSITDYNLSVPVSNQNITEDILLKHRTQITKIIDVENTQKIASTIVDPTSKISNTILDKFSTVPTIRTLGFHPSTSTTPSQKSTVKSIEKVDENISLSLESTELRTIALQSIQNGKDPSQNYKLTNLSQGISEGLNGTHKKSFIPTFEDTIKNSDFLYGQRANRTLVVNELPDPILTFSIEPIKNVESYIDFDIDISLIENSLFFLSIKALDSNDITIQRINQKILINDLLRVYSIPRLPPQVTLIKDDSNYPKRAAKIKQIDPKASFVSIYKKINSNGNISSTPYQLIDRYPIVSRDGEKIIPLDTNRNALTSYRFIAEADDKSVGFDYSSIVISPRKSDLKFAKPTVIISPLTLGNSLEVSDIPANAISIRFLRRNLSTKEKELTPLESGWTFVYGKTAAPFIVSDLGPKEDNYYEYWYEIQTKFGKTIKGICAYSYYKPLQQQALQIQLLNPVTTTTQDGKIDCKFTIQTTLSETVTDRIRTTSKNQEQNDLFSSEIEKQKSDLSKLVAHRITRIDLSSGDIQELGITSELDFSDLSMQNSSAATPLEVGKKYRYIVTPLLRSAESLFADNTKTATAKTNGKTYSYSPFKYKHPYSLNRGTLITQESLTRNHAFQDFDFGAIGSLTTFDVEIKTEPFGISNLKIERLDKSDILTWESIGNLELIDHYRIVSKEDGLTKVVGKVFHDYTKKNYVFIRDLSDIDYMMDNRVYEVVPVKYDYELDQSYIVEVKK